MYRSDLIVVKRIVWMDRVDFDIALTVRVSAVSQFNSVSVILSENV